MRRASSTLVALALSVLCSSTGPARAAGFASSPRSSAHFEPAPPELGPEAVAVHRARDLTLWIGSGTATLVLRSGQGLETLRLAFGSGRPTVRLEEALPARSHYLLGNDPRRFRTNVARYRRVRLEEAWKGIDVVFHGDRGALEYDLVARPGADLSRVRVAVEGASSVSVSAGGDLVLGLACGELVQAPPVVYQEVAGARQVVPGRFALRDGGFGFEVEADPQAAVVVDPYLSWVSVLGGSSDDELNAISVDGAGNAYVVGTTLSGDYPLSAPYQPAFGGLTDVVITKLDPGGQVVWSTYLGGSGADDGRAIARDGLGKVWIAGSTTSTTFPVVNGFQSALASPPDAFIAALAPGGDGIVFSSLLGGGGFDSANALAIGPGGEVAVAGDTESTDFPLANAAQPAPGGQRDAFLARVSAGGGLAFSTYLGGSGIDTAQGVAVDPSGHSHVGGGTTSSGFPQLRPAVPGPGYVAAEDGFLSTFDAGGALVSSTTFGGSGVDRIRAVAAAPDGSIYAAGQTSSADLPVNRALQPSLKGPSDAFLLRLSPLAASLSFSTYLGGDDGDEGAALAAGADGVLLAGTTHSYFYPTASTSFPTASPLQRHVGGDDDVFVSRFSPDGALAFSSLLGGVGLDRGLAVALGAGGEIVIAGNTGSSGLLGDTGGFPTPKDGFLARVEPDGSADVSVEILGPATLTSEQIATYQVRVTNAGPHAVPVRLTASAATDSYLVGELGPTVPPGWVRGPGWAETVAMPPGQASFGLALSSPSVCEGTARLDVRAGASTPATTDPEIGNNVLSRAVTVTTGLPGAATISGQGSFPCEGGEATLTVSLTAGSLPAEVRILVSDGDWFYVDLRSEPSASVTRRVVATTTFVVESVTTGGCIQTPGGSQTTVNVAPDNHAPTVTPPQAAVLLQRACLNAQPVGYYFSPHVSVVDDCDSRPERLESFLDGSPFYGEPALVEAGHHVVTHRYRDNAGNVGAASQAVTVVRIGDLDRDGDADVHDVVILAAYLVGNVEPGSAPFLAERLTADTSDDAVVDLFDLLLLSAHVVGNVGCLRP